jgi:hypothetical protein
LLATQEPIKPPRAPSTIVMHADVLFTWHEETRNQADERTHNDGEDY